MVDPDFKLKRGEGLTDTFFTFLREYSDAVILALVDVKIMTSGCNNKDSTYYCFRTTRAQLETIYVLIMASLFDPDFIAVVSMHYIPPIRSKDRQPLADAADKDMETTLLPTI